MEFNTEQEREAFNCGMDCVVKYIALCRGFYAFKFNFGGAVEFVLDISKFICGESNQIPNQLNVSFPQFKDAYLKYCANEKNKGEEMSILEMCQKYLS